jgi:hypothetical protein
MNYVRTVDKEAETSGREILFILENMGTYQKLGEMLVKKNGIFVTSREQWFPLKKWVNALKQIVDVMGPNSLHTLGKRCGSKLEFPEDVQYVGTSMSYLKELYKKNYKLEDDHHILTFLTDTKLKIESVSVYPCEYESGLLESILMDFSTGDCKIYHEPSDACRKKGKLACSYILEW